MYVTIRGNEWNRNKNNYRGNKGMQGLQFAMEIVKSFKNVIISSIIRCNY